jgi:hypothetical protein
VRVLQAGVLISIYDGHAIYLQLTCLLGLV